MQLFDNNFSSFKVLNRGNTDSRPTLTIYGTGTVKLSINSKEVFTLNLEGAGYITLNGLEMNAYKGDALMNRSVSGDFNDLVLRSGMNVISWTGNVTQILVEKGSRWI
jgi:phage-related protein